MYIAFSFLLTWNVIAMEAAACYIGETRNPDRDAKIAMNLEGVYGLFIYTMIPVAFIIVIGAKRAGQRARPTRRRSSSPSPPRCSAPAPGSSILDWLIAIMLILALILSALNAITGTARSLHQMSMDGQFPKFFQHVNHHGVPNRAMIFNVVCSILVVFAGGAVQIYTLSNVGYLASFMPVLVGYYLLRKHRPNVRRPFKLPEWMKYVALAIAALYAVIYFYGGPVTPRAPVTPPAPRRCPTTSSAGACCSPTCRCTGGASDTRTSETPRAEAVAAAAGDAGAGRRRSVSATALGGRAHAGHAAPSSGSCSPRRAGRSRRGGRPRDRARRPSGASVHVFTIARVHGTAFGLPSPGLLPTKSEWAEQRDIVAKAIKRLSRKGIEAEGQVVGTRDAAKQILQRGREGGLRGDRDGRRPRRNRVVGNFMWTQEPQRVRRRAKIPVFLVQDD